MHKTKNTLLIIAAIVIVGCLLYIPGMNKLGLYRDDWNNFYNLTVRGTDTLIKAYGADRPADGYLIAVLYRIFGTNITAYFIWNLCCRILGSVFFALSLLIIWPRTPKMAGFAGVLAVAFPGFLQQIDGIAYVPHQTAMLCFMLSLWLTALACEPGQKSWNVLFTFLSMLFSFAYMMLMEYYVGMEIYRLALIYMMNREQAGNGRPKSFFKCLLSFIPYLIPVGGFLVWRVFFFEATRTGADVMTEVVKPFLLHPRHEIADNGVRFMKNVWKLFAGVWTVPAYNLLNGLEMKAFVKALIAVVIIAAAGQLFLFLMHRRKTDESILDADRESSQWLWFGLICGSIAILPLVVSGHDINFSASLDRFTWPGMIGAILFLAGLLGSLDNRVLRNLLTIAALVISVFVQVQNQVKYIEIWQNTKDYWQQMIWRAPSIQEGTTIVTAGSILAEEDYEIFSPASMIYYPLVNSWAPVSAEILSENTARDIKMGEKVYRRVREIYTEKDYNQLLAVSKPDANSCLRVIDGSSPIYSVRDYSKIPEIGSWSKPEQILTDPETAGIYPFFLGEEQPHNWCYYYEKIELALQMEDAESAARLADEAAVLKLKAGDSVELIAVAEAYLRSGRSEDALPLAEEIRKDAYLNHQALNYFNAKEDSGVYQEFIDALSGKNNAAEENEPLDGELTDEEPTTEDHVSEESVNEESMDEAPESNESISEEPTAEAPESSEPVIEDPMDEEPVTEQNHMDGEEVPAEKDLPAGPLGQVVKLINNEEFADVF